MKFHSVWMLAASIRPDACETFTRWHAAGYRVAALIDGATSDPGTDIVLHVNRYEGHAKSINRLSAAAMSAGAGILVAGSDDLEPCVDRCVGDLTEDFHSRFPDGFGAMHLSKHDLSHGQSTDHCWFGAEYAKRINGGRGLYWPEYFHYFDDTEAGAVADLLGVLWRRPEYGQVHRHWSLTDNQSPAHLAVAQSRWSESANLYQCRRDAGFPGHEPLPCTPASCAPVLA